MKLDAHVHTIHSGWIEVRNGSRLPLGHLILEQRFNRGLPLDLVASRALGVPEVV